MNVELNISRPNGMPLTIIKDIAAFKPDAITTRKTKKDFYDIYFLLKNLSLPLHSINL